MLEQIQCRRYPVAPYAAASALPAPPPLLHSTHPRCNPRGGGAVANAATEAVVQRIYGGRIDFTGTPNDTAGTPNDTDTISLFGCRHALVSCCHWFGLARLHRLAE